MFFDKRSSIPEVQLEHFSCLAQLKALLQLPRGPSQDGQSGWG